MTYKDLFSYIFLSLAWGISFLVIVKVVNAFGWVGAVTFRAFVAGITLLLVAFATQYTLDFKQRWKSLTIVGATTVAAQLIGLSYATPLIGTAMAAIIVSTIPLFSMLISHFWGIERFTYKGLLGLFLGFAGMILLVGFPAVPITSTFLIGCLASTLASFAAAFGSNYASHRLKDLASTEITIGSFLSGGIMTLPLLYFVPVPSLPAFSDFVYLFILGAGMSALTYVLYFRLVAHIGATKTITVEFVVTIVAVLIGTILLHESISVMQIVGACTIIGGCVLVLDT